MKLYHLALLVGFIIISSAAADEPCENILPEEDCEKEKAKHGEHGCFSMEVWQKCRKLCDACSAFANEHLGKHVAVLYEGNHILTWDRLPFDCTARGEFILYRNSDTGMKVHALFTRPEGLLNSVTTAVTAIDSSSEKLEESALQMALKRNATGPGCELLFWIGKEKVPFPKVAKPGGYKGIRKVRDIFERDAFIIDLLSGARILLSVRRDFARGCFFAKVELRITTEQTANTTGLLGTPDSYIYNDWQKEDGSYMSLPSRSGRYLKPAYDYATSNWCVRKSNESITYYDRDHLGAFDDYNNCDAEYDGLADFSSATPKMERLCGKDNYECLHDYISIFPEGDKNWTRTNEMMAIVETNTVSVVKGLNVSPRGLLADTSTRVRITVKLNETVPDLNGFALAELSQTEGLIRTGKVLSFLSDDGNGSFGDSERLDNVYSKFLSFQLENGLSRGFYVIPLIKGKYQDDRKDLMFTLPDAIRGLSLESGRVNIENGLVFERNIILGMEIEVHYIWQRYQGSVETATKFAPTPRFLREGVGTVCDQVGNRFLSCDCHRKGFNKVTVDIERAFTNNRENFTTYAVPLKLYGVWREGGSGPIDITVVAKLKRNRAEIPGTFLTMSVKPKERTEVACASEDERNHLGTLTIRKMSADGRWRFALVPSEIAVVEVERPVQEEQHFLDPINVHKESQSFCSHD